MKVFTVLLVAAGVASAATVPQNSRHGTLVVRQNSTETSTDAEEADVDAEVEDEEENSEVRTQIEDEDVSSQTSSLNFDDFSLSDFINLGVTDVLNIDNLSQHELDLATVLDAMLNGLGFSGLVSIDDFIGFGFNAQLQMFLAFQQIAQLLSIGRLGINDAFGLIRGNLISAGFTGFGNIGGFRGGFNGFGGLSGLNGINNLNVEDLAASLGINVNDLNQGNGGNNNNNNNNNNDNNEEEEEDLSDFTR
ncbi:hypothetical protein SAPIO_CDS7520 [Scedosporium apiospermum]|uniref:Uncharacterized protein n=1 Tax=Pseudallescheria apiosperma TaxID=563466 RepID=A0A084G234_PSEDA|nr:uncharacterized protein SAPIO_CDS7520 [Scedosporium apiospermum]KEZ41396.1 hypothetical protein SAPIO_CDS7520 [Scedosporium apiospermum]